MSHILYVLAVNYDWKHLENPKVGLENYWIFFLPKEWEPWTDVQEWIEMSGSATMLHAAEVLKWVICECDIENWSEA